MSEELNEKIKTVINEKIRPSLQMDGGDIEFLGLKDDNIAQVRLKGACRGCPAAAMTLSGGVERILKEEIPEIQGIENVA